MSQISKFLFIQLTILLALSVTLGSAGKCEVCMYDGTVYRDQNGDIAAPTLCRQVADEMTSDNKDTIRSTCVYKNWYTHFKDAYGQKTYCRIQCDKPTPCRVVSRSALDPQGLPYSRAANLGRMDLPCNEWPAK
ncbi:secreted protein [Melampsora americana]|nr:secreted protein [Melampsora americana]